MTTTEHLAYDRLEREWPGQLLRLHMPHLRHVPDYHWQHLTAAGFMELKTRVDRRLTHPVKGGQVKWLRDYQAGMGMAGVLVLDVTGNRWEFYADLDEWGVHSHYHPHPTTHRCEVLAELRAATVIRMLDSMLAAAARTYARARPALDEARRRPTVPLVG